VGACPCCGCSLTAGGETPSPAIAVVEPGISPDESGAAEFTEALLIADLREAFRPAEAPLEPTLPARPPDPGSLLPPATLTPHARLGDFEILSELGRGGMGIVYRARQVSLGREVALKVLPGYARHGHSAVERFQAEAQAAARIHHTNVVPIYAQGEHQGHYYYAMELINGVGLDTVIRSRPDLLSTTRLRAGPAAGSTQRPADGDSATQEPGPSPVSDDSRGGDPRWTRADYRHIASLLADVADALHCAHRQGVIHRDVKPHNLLLGMSDSEIRLAEAGQTGLTQRLHLTDFGLARLTDAPHLTLSGEVMGTPAYLSPEQVAGHPAGIDHRTDIYSLGVTLYEVLTRRKPFDGETREEIMAGICTAEPLALRRVDPRVPIDLETVCLRAMEKDPARRHPTAALLAEDLRRFADGRPILSRRTSRLVKAGKWVHRHKALTTTLAGAMAVLILAGGWAWSAQAARDHEAQARQREARRLLDDAYAQLAYYDFRKPELIEPDIERAAALGADPVQLHLVRALAAMGHNDPPTAIGHLNDVLQARPADVRALYLLSWAQCRGRDLPAGRATFDRAEQLRTGNGSGRALSRPSKAAYPSTAGTEPGRYSDQQARPELTPDAWFFRGLAIHFADSAEAINSYREANAARVREHGFYPQAVLHLARARNQQLYSTRSLEAFPEARASLQQLAEQGYYEALPYYLLSIAQRLAAEIYKGSQGTRGDQPVTENYVQALDWARRGQQVDPTDDRPISAEAECLESMGLYAEAIAARTRAIAVADAQIKRCEGYHYRWRLYYWTGDLDAALADVQAHAACDPNSPYYAHVYPALILAEMGDWPAALAHARALADDAPHNAQAVLWSATCLRLLGQPAEAAELLAARADAVDYAANLVPPQTETWVRALYSYCLAGGDTTSLEELAQQTPAPWKLSGEAHFHAGAQRLAEGDRGGALEAFQKAYQSFDSEERYTYQARLICVQMQKTLAWPQWIAVSWRGVPGGWADPTVAEPTTPAPDEPEERKSP